MTPDQTMAPAAEEDQTRFTIEIEVLTSGKIEVSVESGEQEAAETAQSEQMGEEGAESSTQVNSIREAVALALEIYRNGGQMPSSDTTNLEAGFNSNG